MKDQYDELSEAEQFACTVRLQIFKYFSTGIEPSGAGGIKLLTRVFA